MSLKKNIKNLQNFILKILISINHIVVYLHEKKLMIIMKLIIYLQKKIIDLQIEQNIESKAKLNIAVKTNIDLTKNEYKSVKFPRWDFPNRDIVMKCIDCKENIKNISIELCENIYFLPNIFSNNNVINISGIVFVYLHELEIILIIPGYMVPLFYDNYLIFNTKLDKININIEINSKKTINIKQIKTNIENLDFIKILNSKKKVESLYQLDSNTYKTLYLIDSNTILISCFLLHKNELLSLVQQKTFELYYKIQKDNYIDFFTPFEI